MSTSSPHPLDRLGFLAAGTGALLCWAVCADDGVPGPAAAPTSSSSTTSPMPSTTQTPTSEPPADRDVALGPADFAALSACVLLREMAAGPFPTLEQLERRDITEGYPGRPLQLGLRVINGSCEPIPGVAVEVWHTDASGDYSSYADGGTGKDEGTGTTFLRGRQLADGEGIVEFATIYPGWYPGRAVHIHVRVRRDGDLVLTSQLFFPDDTTREVFAAGPYAEFGPPDTTNATDGLGGDIATNGSLLSVTPRATGAEPPMRALLNLGIRA
jgi:protocatechuate 3,4-dioxygenase beta subunit